jgi:hypothetical protein
MASLRKLVVDPCIGRHLGALLASSPILGGQKKSAGDTASAIPFGDIPAPQITSRTRRIATIGVRTQADFGKARQRAIRCVSATKLTIGMAPGVSPASIGSSSRACSTAGVFGHGASRSWPVCRNRLASLGGCGLHDSRISMKSLTRRDYTFVRFSCSSIPQFPRPQCTSLRALLRLLPVLAN